MSGIQAHTCIVRQSNREYSVMNAIIFTVIMLAFVLAGIGGMVSSHAARKQESL